MAEYMYSVAAEIVRSLGYGAAQNIGSVLEVYDEGANAAKVTIRQHLIVEAL